LLPPNFNNKNSREHLLRIPLTPPRAPSKRVVVEEKKKKKKRSFYIMRLLKKKSGFEKTKNTPLYKKNSLFFCCVVSLNFWARFFFPKNVLHFISSQRKVLCSAKLFLFVFEDRYYTLS